MDRKSEDLSEGNGLPQPGTDESGTDEKTPAGDGPGNVSVDEPTAGALDEDAGSPGGAEESDSATDDAPDDEDSSDT